MMQETHRNDLAVIILDFRQGAGITDRWRYLPAIFLP